MISDAMFYGQRSEIAALGLRQRLPGIAWTGEFAKSGLMLTYGPDLFTLARRAAAYTDKILKGAKPSDLPIEQPSKFELVVNQGRPARLAWSFCRRCSCAPMR